MEAKTHYKEVGMSKTESTTARIRLYMSMSLDGFIAGPDDRAGQELGRNGGRLFDWLDDRESDGPSGQVYRELLATGAVISGRRTFELAGRWQGDHHNGVPIFVLTHHADDGDVPPGHARFVTDVETCARSPCGCRRPRGHGPRGGRGPSTSPGRAHGRDGDPPGSGPPRGRP